MTYRIRHAAKLFVFVPFCLAMIGLAGCFGSPTMPSTVLVELPDGTTVEADQGAGVASLVNTKWQFYRTAQAAQGISFLTLSFGPSGSLDSFENNTIAQEIFGSTLIFDGKKHATSQSGLSYAASTYGAETSDSTGFSFVAKLTAYAAGIEAGNATATATGTFDPDDADTMTGTFAFTTQVTLPIDIPGADQDDEFYFIAHRVIE